MNIKNNDGNDEEEDSGEKYSDVKDYLYECKDMRTCSEKILTNLNIFPRL